MPAMPPARPAAAGNSAAPADFDCQLCGACCSYDDGWPRFSLESEAAIDRIPAIYVAGNGAGMRCEGGRCAALAGEVGRATACRIYALRPDVCRACEPGDEACRIARRHFGLAV